MVESLTFVPLPIAVQPHIRSKSNLSWPESTARIVYVDLKGYVDEYAMVPDKKEFE